MLNGQNFEILSPCLVKLFMYYSAVLRPTFLFQDPAHVLVILVTAFDLLESSFKSMKNDTTFVRMHSSNHLGDSKMSKNGTPLRRI